MKTKILFYDIETSPLLGYTWAKYEQNVLDVQREWYVLSFSAKWKDGGTITKALPDYKLYKKEPHNDRELIKDLWELFNEADIIIGHNSNKFDNKKSNARFIAHGLTPPEPYKTVDTLKVARQHFSFTSNRLDDLGKALGVGRKVKTGGFDLWLRCLAGDMKAWALMKKYNKQDVVLLEKVYLKLRPWATNHPNLSLFEERPICPKCGSKKIHFRGYAMTSTSKYRRFQCECGGWGRSRVNVREGEINTNA